MEGLVLIQMTRKGAFFLRMDRSLDVELINFPSSVNMMKGNVKHFPLGRVDVF